MVVDPIKVAQDELAVRPSATVELIVLTEQFRTSCALSPGVSLVAHLFIIFYEEWHCAGSSANLTKNIAVLSRPGSRNSESD